MNTIIELQKQILALPALAREQLAAVAGERLVGDPGVGGKRNIYAIVENDIRRCFVDPISHTLSCFAIIDAETIRILVIRHHRRCSGLGIHRL
ncbi:MAG: hypothetical protein ACRERU_03550 [Methylococcales bacterium]